MQQFAGHVVIEHYGEQGAPTYAVCTSISALYAMQLFRIYPLKHMCVREVGCSGEVQVIPVLVRLLPCSAQLPCHRRVYNSGRNLWCSA